MANAAYGELILLKSGRFIYNLKRSLDSDNYSEGVYRFKMDTLILNSDLQNGNLKIRVEYSYTPIGDTQERRLSFARNLNGDRLHIAGYFFNNDTAIRSSYYGDFQLSYYPNNYLQEIKSLKLEVSPGINSSWIPILKNNKYIIVTGLSHADFNEYSPKVLTNYKFLKRRNSVIDLLGDL